jgi:mRNA-degrading endonuclease RelE of RelBE toxin-antitoxin system
MKTIVTTPSVEIALRTLDDDNRQRVQAVFGHLANGEGDDFVRNHSQSLDSVPGVYVLKTGNDLRVFFTMHGNTVTVIDIGKKQSILASAQVPEAD